MSLLIVRAVKRGSTYVDLWPTNEPVLKAAFREVRVAILLRFGRIVVPPIVALLLFLLYYSVGGLEGFKLMFTYPQAFAWYTYMSCASVMMSIACILMFNLVGYVWMAEQSWHKLTPHQEHFYRELMKKLGKEPEARPRMLQLAQAINEACKTLKDKSFLNEV